MTKKTPNSPLDLVTGLMQERAKFETWLATLESRRDATPANVYERVRHDYETRLSGVLDELKSHAVELAAQAERYTARLAELAEQEQARRDARAEAELRSLVGELSAEAWDATAKAADDALAAIAAEQAVAGADLNRVHELLGAATGASAPSAPRDAEPERAPAPDRAPAAPAEGRTASAPPPQPPAAEPAAGAPASRAGARRMPEQTSFDELAFLKSVVSPLVAKTPVPPAGATRAVKSTGPQIVQDPSDGLAESLVSRANRPSQERAFVRDEPDDPAAGLVGQAPEAEQPADRPYAANVTGNHPIVLRPSGAVEQPKTLKCAECGAMNYPTEWYCERCGAELATL